MIEPNPNWSTVGLRDYKDDWPWGRVTTVAGLTTMNRGTSHSLQFPHLKFSILITDDDDDDDDDDERHCC